MSLRWRVVLIVMAVALATAAAGLAAVVVGARAAVQAETGAALEAAEFAVAAELGRAGTAVDAATLMRMLGGLKLRHAHVEVREQGRILLPAPPPEHRAPAWFAALVGAGGLSRELALAGGQVVIRADPGDEVAEAWSDAATLAWIAALALLLLLLAVYAAVTRALAPLSSFAGALDNLERVEPAAPDARGVPDLALIGTRIAALGSRLARARRENAELSRALLETQDRERRDLARDLHDELGPLLFAIRVDAHAVARAAAEERLDPAEAAARAGSIADAAAEIRALSRRILGRLRPVALDHLSLTELLADVLEAQRRQHPGVDMVLDLSPGLDAGLPEAAVLTVYRVVQEGVLNALRHGDPTRLRVTVTTCDGSLRILVEDDGRGIGTAPFHRGHGLAGMRERVQALGGHLSVGAAQPRGTRLLVELPRDDEQPPLRQEGGAA